jgi:hypothetical protein
VRRAARAAARSSPDSRAQARAPYSKHSLLYVRSNRSLCPRKGRADVEATSAGSSALFREVCLPVVLGRRESKTGGIGDWPVRCARLSGVRRRQRSGRGAYRCTCPVCKMLPTRFSLSEARLRTIRYVNDRCTGLAGERTRTPVALPRRPRKGLSYVAHVCNRSVTKTACHRAVTRSTCVDVRSGSRAVEWTRSRDRSRLGSWPPRVGRDEVCAGCARRRSARRAARRERSVRRPHRARHREGRAPCAELVLR